MKFLQTLYLLTALLLLKAGSAIGQAMPDSIVITRITYVNRFIENGDTVYATQIYPIVSDGKTYKLNNRKVKNSIVQRLLKEISNPNNKDNSLAKYGLDTGWIINYPSKQLALYSGQERFDWNESQKEFIYKELSDISNHHKYLQERLSEGGSYTIHRNYKYKWQVSVFHKGQEPISISSRKYAWGYMMPWEMNESGQIFNYKVERALDEILLNKIKTKEPPSGRTLLKYLVNEIVDDNVSALYRLAAHSYQKEIDELKSDFTVLGAAEVCLGGGYRKTGQDAIKIVLRNESMIRNVSINFFASKQNNSIYSRDSIKKDYKQYIERFQGIPFITDFLNANPKSRLEIFYFNNKGINDENIDNINKSPEQWKQHDHYIKSLETSRKLGVNFSSNTDEAIATSQQLYCGCNYRYDKSYLEKAILFTIVDEYRNHSTWLLLPDNKVLLYLMQGEKVLHFSYKDFGNSVGLQYPCRIFDGSGQSISK